MRSWRVIANVWASKDRYVFMHTFIVEGDTVDTVFAACREIVDPFNNLANVQIMIVCRENGERHEWCKTPKHV